MNLSDNERDRGTLPARIGREAKVAAAVSAAAIIYPFLLSAAGELYRVVTSDHTSIQTVLRALVGFGPLLSVFALVVFLAVSFRAGVSERHSRAAAMTALILMAASGIAMAWHASEIVGSPTISLTSRHTLQLRLALGLTLCGCWCLFFGIFAGSTSPMAMRLTASISAATLAATLVQGLWATDDVRAVWARAAALPIDWPRVVVAALQWSAWFAVCLFLVDFTWFLSRRKHAH